MKKVWVLVIALALVMPLIAAAAEPAAAPPAKPSVTSKLAVDFYGYVKLDAGYQHGYANDNFISAAPAGNLVTTRNALRDEQLNKDQNSFWMTARQSRIGFWINGPASDNGLKTRGHLEADFYGTPADENKGLLTLRIATVEIYNDSFNLLAGNDWMVVSPIFPHTNNYLYGLDLGNMAHRIPQIRLSLYALDQQLALQVAAVNKIGELDSLDVDTGRMNASPTWEWAVIYKNNENKFMLAYSGHFGLEEIQSKHYGKVGYYGANVPSFSHGVSLQLPLGDFFAINGEYYQGANLDGYYCGGQQSGWVLNKNRRREPLHSQGGWGEIMIKPNDSVRLYLGYGIDDVDDYQLYKAIIEPGYTNGNGNTAITKNQEYFANLELYINPSTKIAFEYKQVISEYGNAQHQIKKAAVPNVYGKVATPIAAPVRNNYSIGKVDRFTVSFWYIF